MRLPEQKLYDWLERKIGHRCMLERVENRVKRNTPDLYLASDVRGMPVCGWIELKVLDAWPKREATVVRLEHWTSGQRYWATRHAMHGGTTWLVLGVGEEVLIVNAKTAALECDRWTQADWREKSEVVWRKADHLQVLDALGAQML